MHKEKRPAMLDTLLRARHGMSANILAPLVPTVYQRFRKGTKMSTPFDSTLLSALHRCFDCGTVITEPAWRPIGENVWVPICAWCYDQRMLALDRDLALAQARVIVLDAHDLLNDGHSFGPRSAYPYSESEQHR
jgi:hypothetical protein